MAFVQLCDAVASMVRSGVPADSDALVALRAQLDQLAALLAEAEVRFDTHELWRDTGAGSMRGWYADHCELGRRGAADQIRRLQRLEQWPDVTDAWVSQRLNAAQIDLIAGVVPKRFRGLFAQQAAEIIDIIAPLDVTNTETAMRQWVRCAESADGPEQFRQPPTGLHLDRVLDGRFVMHGEFDSADAAIIAAAIHDFATPDPIDTDGQPIGEPRTPAQRNSDAMIAICRFAITHREGTGDNGRFLPHISLIVDINELRASALRGAGIHLATSGNNRAGSGSFANNRAGSGSFARSGARTLTEQLEQLAVTHNWSAAERAWFTDALHHHGTSVTFDGTELDATATALHTCDSIVQRVLMAGNKVLNMGRETRTATPTQRRAIITRDRHCRAPGCHTRPEHCDVHHIDHWINGGHTDIHRMVLLCSTHHRQFHRPGHHMELDDNARFTIHSPKGWTRTTTPDHNETQHFPDARP